MERRRRNVRDEELHRSDRRPKLPIFIWQLVVVDGMVGDKQGASVWGREANRGNALYCGGGIAAARVLQEKPFVEASRSDLGRLFREEIVRYGRKSFTRRCLL